MVTWLFSARHSLVSNYRFPSGDAAAPDLISYYSRKHLRRSENPYVENCASMCVLPVTARIVLRSVRFVRPSVRPSSLRRRVCVPLKVFPVFFLLSMLVRRQHASQVHHTSHVTSPTGGVLVRRDPWRRRHAMTHCSRARVKHNLYCFL